MQMGKRSGRKSCKTLLTACQPSAERIDSQDTYSLEFDGASKGNPGRAGAGAILKRPDGTVLCQLTKGVGTATCNFAEYQALILGLQAALDRGICHIRAQGDSKLVCSQLMGRWKVNSQNLSASFSEAMKLKKRFRSFSIQHVYREFNAAADSLANTAVELPDGEPRIQWSLSPDPSKASEKHKGAKGSAVKQSSWSWQDVLSKPTKGSSFSQEENEKFYRLDYHGASNGKNASAGAVLYSPDGTLNLEINEGLGLATRNVAQYQALVIGLRAALECNVSHVKIQGDALLVYKQMIGSIKVKDERLRALWIEANDLLTRFSEFTITNVDKSQNSEACALAEVALQSPDGWPKNDNMKAVGASSRNSLLAMGGCEALNVRACAGDSIFKKMENPRGSSMERFYIAARCPQFPTPCQGMFFPSYSHQGSRAPRLKGGQSLPLPVVMSKCLPLYAADTSIHRVALRCASSRARIIPQIFQRSLIHVQASCVYKSAFSTSIFR